MGVVAAATGGSGRGDVCTGESCDTCEVGGARLEEGVESEAVGRGGAGAPATAEM